MNKYKKIFWAVILIGFFITWSISLYFFSPSEIVDYIGIQKGYLLAFFVAFLGGTSIFFPFPYYLVILTLGAGGLNPFLLGVFGGSGVILGDSTSYLIGYKANDVVPKKFKKIFDKIYNWCLKHPKYLMPLFLFIYGSMVPLPNDIIVISMGLIRYPYWKVIVPIGIGNIIFNILTALAGFYGLNLLF